MTEPTLRRLLHTLVAASLASPLVFGAGCSSLPDPATFSLPSCNTGGTINLDGLMTASPLDYLELRQRSSETTFDTVAKTGTACKTATNVATCTSQLAALPTTPSFHQCIDYDCGHSLAGTAGDKVTAYLDAAAVQTLLGTINTPQEAVLTAYVAGYDLSCTDKSAGGVREALDGDGYELLVQKVTSSCAPFTVTSFHLKVSKAGVLTVLASEVKSSSGACAGRRPDGLCTPAQSACTSPVGAFLATSAHLEAASVTAFRRLRAELRTHGAPARLLRAASRAARDEIRHTRMTSRLAARYHAAFARPQCSPQRLRSLEEMATENTVEGCVRETFGALVGLYQAGAAQDPNIARAMTTIAADEVRHAALAWQVARWAQQRLSPTAQQRVASAREAAVAQLRSEVTASLDPELQQRAGLPPPSVALGLVEQLAQTLWA